MYLFGLLCCAVFGASLGGTAAGALHLTDSDAGATGVMIFVISVNVAPWAGLAGFALLAAARRRGVTAVPAGLGPLVPALARIETSRAIGEGPDIPLSLGLTVVPDGRPGYRVDTRAVVNLMDDLDGYRVGRILVVDHDPEQPWRVVVQRSPSAEWASRAALAKIDCAPLNTLATRPAPSPSVPGRRGFHPGLTATVVGLAASVALFWHQFTS